MTTSTLDARADIINGSTTIPAKSQRVVTVGFTDPDFVLALGVEPVAITDHPLYPKRTVAREGRELFLTDKVLVGAVAFGSMLSLPYALDRIVPMLAAALDGDPTTVPVS